MINAMLIEMLARAQRAMQEKTLRIMAGQEELPPGYMPPDEPIYSLPPDQREPELTFSAALLAAMLADQRDWSHTNLGIPDLFDKGITGTGCLVAVCDTGIDDSHPDLKDRIVTELCRDFTGSSNGWRDAQGHGTHCSGIIGATGNGAGTIGISPTVRLMHSKVLGNNGSGASQWIAKGWKHAIASGADVISLSLGGSQPDPYTQEAADAAEAANVWPIAAAGNDGREAPSYPGNYPNVICIASTDRNDERSSFSTINPANDGAAPGSSIMSTLPGGRYGTMSGTSMATPAFAACLALYRSVLKQLKLPIPTVRQLLEILRRTSKDIAPTGHDSRTGSGLINVGKMIAELGTVPPPPVPIPVPVPPDPPTIPPSPTGWRLVMNGTGPPPTVTAW